MAPLTFLETHFEAAKRQFKSKSDAAILFIHWKLVSLGFKCAGLIPEEEPEKQSLENLSELLPEGWNDDQSNYRIRYVRESTPFNLAVIRTGRAGNYTLVAALLNVEAESVQSFVINVTDEITDDHQTFSKCYKDLGQLNERLETVLNLPFKHGGKGKGAQHKPTRDECTAVIRHILEEQLPNAGFTDDDIRRLVNAICRPSGEGRVPGSRPNPPPRFPEPDFPVVPPPRGLIDPLGGRPLGPVGPIGRSDLDPIGIGGGIPLGPGMGPGIAGPSGGGMLFDPFGRGRHRQPGIPGNLPPGAVPPGARFDPTGPVAPDELFPGFHGNRGKGPSGRGKPSGSRPGAGPDPDHMSPPGYDDMFS